MVYYWVKNTSKKTKDPISINIYSFSGHSFLMIVLATFVVYENIYFIVVLVKIGGINGEVSENDILHFT